MAIQDQRPKAPAQKKPQGPPEINFTKGINTFQVNRLLLDPGEAATLLNADFDQIGALGISQANTVIASGMGRIHSLYKTGDHLFVGEGSNLVHFDVTTMVKTVVSSAFNGDDISMFAYENFLYATEGVTKKKVYIPTLAVTEWGIENPLTAPSGVLGATGLPSGTYSLYYTYVAKYPDGTEYETDLSPVSTCIVELGKIEWTLPETAPDSQITHLRLYRDKSGVVATLDQARTAIEAKQTALEQSSGLLKFGNLFQTIIRSQTNKAISQNMVADPDVIVGPFLIDEVDVGPVGYSDNVSDTDLVQAAPFSRERYRPIFGA
jgi:hypothetical protein